jgi:hypothetical protein
MLAEQWTRWTDAAMRNETPREAPGRESKRAEAITTNSGGEPSSHEDEPSILSMMGAGTARKTIQPTSYAAKRRQTSVRLGAYARGTITDTPKRILHFPRPCVPSAKLMLAGACAP